MKLFPSYETTFSCDCSLQEATERIAEAAACKANDLKIEKACCCAGTQKFFFRAGLPYSPYILIGKHIDHHLPRITLEMKETEQGVLVSVNFAFKKRMRIFIVVGVLIIFLLGAVLCTVNWLSHLQLGGGQFLPFGIAALLYGMEWAGLRFRTGKALEALHYSLTGEFAKHLPSVHRC